MVTGIRSGVGAARRRAAHLVGKARLRAAAALAPAPAPVPALASDEPTAEVPERTSQPAGWVPDTYEGRCSVCGRHELFDRAGKFVRESFLCPTCGSSYRYRHQAEMIIAHLSRRGSSSIDELVEEPEFASMDIYEPGTLGPFRKRLSGLPGYVTSVYSPDVEPGELHEGVRCENLEALTFDDSSIDLIISSDVFEHVRHPDKGFAETLRVLRPGGLHIFTVPIRWPRALPSVPRVDVSGVEDVHLLEPNYHFASLVYNDFGIDLVDRLTAAGFHALLPRGLSDNITVVARRP